MTDRKFIILLLIIGIVTAAVGFMLSDPISLEICRHNDISCDSAIGEGVGQPLMMGSVVFLIITFILLFTSQQVFNVWKKFALVFIPLGALAIIFTPITCHEFICFDKESVIWAVSGLYIAISLLIIVYKQFIKRA